MPERVVHSAGFVCVQMGSPARREQASYPPGQLCYELHWDTETSSSSGETPCGSKQVQQLIKQACGMVVCIVNGLFYRIRLLIKLAEIKAI